MIRIVLIVVAVLLVLVALVWIAGAFLPKEHTVTRSARIDASPEKVFALITDAPSYPSWRTGVTSVDMQTSTNGKMRWKEKGKDGEIEFELTEMISPTQVVVTIVSENLPFGGRWVFALEPDGTGTRLRVTEEGFVKPPPFRFLARFVFGYASTMEGYLRDVGKRFGQEAKVEM